MILRSPTEHENGGIALHHPSSCPIFSKEDTKSTKEEIFNRKEHKRYRGRVSNPPYFVAFVVFVVRMCCVKCRIHDE
jgi:hypothetical protein